MRRTLLGIDLRRFSRWRRQRSVQNSLTLGLVLLGPALAVATFLIISGPLEEGAASPGLRLILLADLIYILLIAALVLQRVLRMVIARRNRSAGSRLHLRLTGVFVLLALIPTVLVAVFALLSINLGFEGWFSDRVQTVLGTSLTTAQAYEDEERNELVKDGVALSNYLNRARQSNFFMNDGDVRQLLQQAEPQYARGLTEVFFLDSAGDIRTRGGSSYSFDYEAPAPEAFAQADTDGIAIIEDSANNEFRALIRMSNFTDRYLYVTREVDGEILALLDETRETVALYEQLERDRGRLLFGFGFVYLGFAVILILAATWLGLWFAERLSRPVGRLVSASQRVGKGDLDVQVIEEEGDDEIAQLGQYFNQMTTQLKGQRDELLETNRQSEQRRRLFDSVLSSVTSGVVGLDSEGRVAFVNPSAQRLLRVDSGKEDSALSVAVPEFAPLFEQLRSEARAGVQDQINLIRKGQQESLLVRMAPRRNTDGALEGYVVAFDDVTDLVSAQRMAAWGDVARRIAHEIKNPLTPIKLSAERIGRKFGKEVDDPEKLAQMTEMIVRQTDDLRRIVDEFSKFARMPEPELKEANLAALVRDAVALQESGQPDVRITAEFPDTPVVADLDSTMISQALTNLIKNAGEAIESRQEKHPDMLLTPQIRVTMNHDDDTAWITIQDNGIGLPEDRTRLFEPYVTTRDKGTGLGLPIVKKIIEEHGGALTLTDAEPFDASDHRGACAIIELPLSVSAEAAKKIPA
ncbi:two-component system, NtrC family, nitrogen regulation sensor histidine kinase NtrY [Cognatiyoonia koreensis]|uniref:histidine kinase n=1 Tax=Cognatiyoonia koreensis TaxID=364200 RepID=A0A1I0P3P5_9RHOB|nr:PAS domain-containing sensor histidine kinase [Cognatiyoonia koreensis]SEW08616.1 two-component system, NtrC family, nitrogen regulation sensor histidine kinase NtrY [Cognatiyoonia koreensis]